MTYRPIITLGLLAVALTPVVVFGNSVNTDFQPLVGIPGVDGNNINFSQYVNAIYALTISIAALLAVVKLVVAGAKYMLSDIVSTKQSAKEDIKYALLGLLIVMSVVLILSTINSNITNFALSAVTFQFDGSQAENGGGNNFPTGTSFQNCVIGNQPGPLPPCGANLCPSGTSNQSGESGQIVNGQRVTVCTPNTGNDSGDNSNPYPGSEPLANAPDSVETETCDLPVGGESCADLVSECIADGGTAYSDFNVVGCLPPAVSYPATCVNGSTPPAGMMTCANASSICADNGGTPSTNPGPNSNIQFFSCS